MSFYKNPFPAADVDRHEIWQMLVERDIIAFCQESWEMVNDDFIKENFIGIDAGKRHNPDSWRLGFPDLEHYKEEWLRQARDFAQTQWAEDPERALYHATTLRDIDIQGDSAVAHKKFDGEILKTNGEKTVLNWQTLYHCRKIGGRWKIAGFTGYLPHPMGFGGEQGTGGRQQLRDALQSKDEFQSRDGLQLKDELQSQEGLQPKDEIRFQAEQEILIKPQTQEKQQNLDRSRTENKQRIQDETQIAAKQVPSGAKQHDTAGPYSPVLQVTPGQLVVISGQAAIDQTGRVVGNTIEEQTHYTLENCRRQLITAGCDLNDVFKVNVYLTDLANWPDFNEVYKTYFHAPLPVRTAVQTPLLLTFLVEIEMWAVKK